ncbi:DUF1997 domain-containing protein [Synechococcus sp. M16CYN]|uniref:DUF1997 domain-containing protein n=1 Tax=Synechococcus sp. M16CYN TaxID=3103139 RepID=UPI00324A9B50
MLLLSRFDTINLRYRDDPQVRCYRSQCSDQMEMLSSSDAVEKYLDRHRAWFERCATPMSVHPLDPQSYKLTLGKFKNFGFEIEPTIALRLLPQDKGIYRIETVHFTPKTFDLRGHYDVDFQASMHLVPIHRQDDKLSRRTGTSVQWDLDLSVWIRLPQVITMLPNHFVQSSGNHLLKQIVRQISRRLTWKVQEDFHASHGLSCPSRRQAAF